MLVKKKKELASYMYTFR